MDAALIYNFTRRKNQTWQKQLKAFEKGASLAGIRLLAMDNLSGLETISKYRRSISFVYLYDYDPYLATSLACMGIPTFNDYQNMETSRDKALTYLKLNAFDLPIPRFYASPYSNGLPYDSLYDYITTELVRKQVRYPFIIRDRLGEPNEVGSLMASPMEFAKFLKERGDKPFICEEYSQGPYYLAYVVGNTCYGVLERRKGAGKFGKNDVLISTCYGDNRFLRSLAVKAIDASGLGAGMVYMRMNGKMPLITGVNASMKTLSFKEITSIDLAERLMVYFKKTFRKKYPFVYKEEKARYLKMSKAANKLKEIDEK